MFCFDRFNPAKSPINYSHLHLRELLKILSNNVSQCFSTVESLPDFNVEEVCAVLEYDEA